MTRTATYRLLRAIVVAQVVEGKFMTILTRQADASWTLSGGDMSEA